MNKTIAVINGFFWGGALKKTMLQCIAESYEIVEQPSTIYH